jgi:hypothetical protein
MQLITDPRPVHDPDIPSTPENLRCDASSMQFLFDELIVGLYVISGTAVRLYKQAGRTT